MSPDLSRSRPRASVLNADELNKSIFHDKDATAGGGCAAAVKLDEQAVLEEYERETQGRALKTVIQP
jgi:hypothetical protein